MAVASFSGRPPADAVAYLQDKVVGGRFSFDWRDLWQDEHGTSFVVAKGMARDLLTDVHGALLKAISEGWTRERFIAELRPTLEAKGWWGRKAMRDPLTGVEREVQLGSPRRLKTIFDINMRMAFAAGRWQRIEAAKAALPYLAYTAVIRETSRPQHAAWGGYRAVRIVLPVDHPFWKTHFPPNGWHCLCSVVQMSVAMLKARDLTVTTDEELKASGIGKTRPWLNRRTGQTIVVPVGIDPGFAYNVGQARLAGLTPPPTPQPQRTSVIGERFPRALPATPSARPLPSGVSLRPELADGQGVFEAFSKALGVPAGGVFTDKVQIPLAIGPELFATHDAAGAVLASKADKAGRGRFAEVIAAALKDPDEIWMSAQLQQDGGTRLVRTYVAAFETAPGERIWMTVVFSDRDGWWFGTTAFVPGKPGKSTGQADRYVNLNARTGTLVYRRPGRRG